MPTEEEAAATADEVQEGTTPWQQMSDNELINYAIELDGKKRKLTEELEPVESKLAAMQDRLLRIFEESGDQSISRHGMTLYVRTELWVYPEGDKAAAAAALKAADLADFVKEAFNVQSVSAYGRELARESVTDDNPLPDPEAILKKHPELRGKLKPTEKSKVVIVKGKSG